MPPRRPVAGRRLPHRLVQPAVEKSLPLALASAGGQIRSGDAALMALRQQGALRGQLAAPLPRDEYPYEFGPNIPLAPAPLDPTGLNGRAEPRLYEYPVSWNLPGQDNRLIPWRTLREAGDHPLIRAAITVRKAEIAGLEWDFTLSRRAVDEAVRNSSGASRLDVEQQLRDRLRPAIMSARAAWQKPDVGNGLTFAEWTSRFLEEHLVLDAAVIYPRLTVGGQWFSFEILDGATVKPLLDHRGGRPLPPQPAYQQILYGFPRGEFTADTSDMDGQLQIPNAYRSDQLIYVQRESRVASPYGLSAVEKCLIDLSLWMKRQEWLRDEYDEAVQPAGWFINEQVGDAWTPSQVLEYEREFNDMHQGNTAARMRYRMLPPGIKPAETGSHDFAEKFKPEFDLHLLKLVLMHLDVSVHELGFTEAKGLGSVGHAEGQDRLNDRKGRLPTLRWMASLFTDISRAHLGLPPELEFQWLGLDDEEDREQNTPTSAEMVAAGLLTINEARDEDGRPRFSFPEADKPFISSPTAGTLTFLEGAEQRQEDEKAQAAQQAADQLAALHDKPAAGTKPAEKPAEKASEKAAEAKAYRRWARQSGNRRFVLKAITAGDLDTYGIDPDRVEVADLGKALWPGWGPDLDISRALTERLRSAALGAVDVAAIATAWIAYVQGQQAVSGQDPGELPGIQHPIADTALAGSVAWLTSRLLPSLTRAFTAPLSWALSAAWALGESSSRQLIGQQQREPAPDTGLGEVTALAEQVARTYVERAARRLDKQADSPDELAAALAETLDSESLARSVAETEASRRISTAAETNYASFGIAGKQWVIAPDQRVCERCASNAAQGPVPVGQDFATGDLNPPAHPHCRCAVVPVYDLPEGTD